MIKSMSQMTRREMIRQVATEHGWELRDNRTVELGGSAPSVDLFGIYAGTWLRVRYSRGGSVIGGTAMDRPTMPWAQDLWGRDKAGQAVAFLTKFTHPSDYRVEH